MSATDFQAAADALLHHESGRLPDLSHCTVILPHLYAAAPLLSALRRRIEAPYFLPPRLCTLDGLADAVPGTEPVEPDGQRLAQVYDFLGNAGVCRPQGLWQVARELLDLVDELTAETVLPETSPTLMQARIRAAYGRLANRLLEDEAKLVLELWHALQQGGHLDPVRDRAQRLALAARQARGPLYLLGLPRLCRLEEGLLRAWAERHPVRQLPWRPALTARQALLVEVWETAQDLPLHTRAARLRAHMAASPLLPDVRLVAGADLEMLARAAALQVGQWLSEGVNRIALITLDRMAARRLRALLERQRILIQDETGWTLSTASVTHVVDRLLDLIQEDCYHRDLLDLLKSPFVFASMPGQARQQAVLALEAAIRREGVASGWTRLLTLARKEVSAALPLLERLDKARSRLQGERRLSQWQQRLIEALGDLGADLALAQDAAGRQLLELLQGLAAETAAHPTAYSLHAWREWLGMQFDRSTFREEDIDSPIRLVSPAGARLRPFDAAILLGADADHLPAAPAGGLFNDAVRRELGLPQSGERATELRRFILDVLAQIPRVLVTWQDHLDGEPNALSPWFEVLDGMHRLAWGASLRQPSLRQGDELPGGAGEAVSAWPQPARLPRRLSASAWQSLVDCPYQFFARHVLGLAPAEEVQEELEKRDYGELIHTILQRFHRVHPRLSETDAHGLLADLTRISREVFAPQLRFSYLGLSWQSRWERRLQDYLAWALAREASGYRWLDGEARFERPLPGLEEVLLYGRVDRLEEGPRGVTVLDYKTRSRSSLRQRLRQPGEDVQLAFYGLLTGAVEAGYLALDDETVGYVEPEGDLHAMVQNESRRLIMTLEAIRDGAALPPQGAPQTCRHCEMRGLCRREHRPS